MGNEQSAEINHQKENFADIKIQNGELNGHAVQSSEESEPVACKDSQQQKSEIPPETDTNKPKPAGKEEVDKAKEPAHIETSSETETATTADEEPAKEVQKQSENERKNIFGKMFKKKAEPVKPASESKDSVDGEVTTVDSEIVIINADQDEIHEETAGNLHLIDTVPTQPISEEYPCSRLPSRNNVEALTFFFEVLPDLCRTPKPIAVAEEPVTFFETSAKEPVIGSQLHEIHTKSVVQAPVSFRYEEPMTADAEQPLIEDKELIKMAEMIISDKEEPLVTNGSESVTVEPKCKDTSVVDSVEALIQDEQPFAETEKPLLVAEEIAAIIKEILQITEDQTVEETMRQTNEAEELRNTDRLDVAEAPETLSVESAVVVKDETAYETVENIFAANGTAAVDEEEIWVIIEEPISNHTYPGHLEAVDEPVTAPASEEERISAESKSHLAKSSKLFSRLRSVCTEALEDSSYKPISVDVCGNESTINITIEICPNVKSEFGNTAVAIAEDGDFNQKIQENGVHCSTVSVAIEASTEAKPEPEGIADELLNDLVEVAEETLQSEEPKESEKKVMNFFKSFASPTKTSKEAKATSDASKDQSQKETPPAPSANVQEAPKAPPPPPPAPPKMEGKAEPAVKKEETSATAATKAAEASAKTKTKDSAFGKLFRPKILLGKVLSKVQPAKTSGGRAKTSGVPVVVEEIKPIEVEVEKTQVDASKTSTLEAAAKPEEPPAPKQEEKKQEEKKLEKKSTFGKLFKPKVLLGQVTTRIQAAASSAAASISLVSPRSAPEPKKETPAAPVAAESAPIAKAIEEPKPTVPAAPDNKSVESTDNASPSAPRKLEKRNSVQLFFKSLGQKRHSTDAGVQTDPVAPEKAK